MTLLLEERLLFKLLQWAGLGGKGAWSGASGTSKSSEEDELMNMISQRYVYIHVCTRTHAQTHTHRSKYVDVQNLIILQVCCPFQF